MVRVAPLQRACADRCASATPRSARHPRVLRRIGAQLQKRLQNGHFLYARKELCGRLAKALTTFRAAPLWPGIVAPDADSRHEKKFAQISLRGLLSLLTRVRIARIGTD